MIPLAVGGIWLGGYPMAGLLLLIFGAAAFELGSLADPSGDRWRRLFGPVLLAVLMLAFVSRSEDWALWLALLGTALLAVGYLAASVLAERSPTSFFRFAAGGATLIYLAPPMLAAWAIRDIADDPTPLLFVVAAVSGFDTCAYLVGRPLGKRKLSPTISPGKTVEGIVGGTVGAIAIGGSAGLLIGVDPFWLALAAAALGLAGQLGDLLESAIKRSFDVKDSGSIIPGHGGVLDRIDSYTLALPVGLAMLLVGVLN